MLPFDSNASYVFEYVIKSAFYQRFNTRSIDVSLDTYNGTSGTAKVYVYQLHQYPMDIRVFDNARNTIVHADTEPFTKTAKYNSFALAKRMRMDIRVDGFFTRVILISGMEAYNDKIANDFMSIFTGPTDSTQTKFAKSGVELSYPLLTLSAPFTKFEPPSNPSCTVAYAPEHNDNFPPSREIFSLKLLNEYAATMNISERYSIFDDIPIDATVARGADTASVFIETYFNSVEKAVLSSLALSMNMTVIETYMFNTTNSSKFGNVHAIRGNLVAVPMGDDSVKAGKAGIQAMSGVVGNPTTGYILRAPVATCTKETVDHTIELIKASKSPAYASGGWIEAAAC